MSRVSAVSVILPVYNGERFLGQAIESVLHQSHADFELLVLDDGSSDRSTDIARTYAETDRRIHVHVQPVNRGITATLNAGVHLARGEFIAIANQDDVCLPERLTKQVAFLRGRQEVVIVGAAAQIIDERSVVRTLKSYPVDPAMAAWRMYFGSTLLHPVSTLRRRALLEIGGYPTGYRGGSEDYAMNVRLARIGRVANLPDVLFSIARIRATYASTIGRAASRSRPYCRRTVQVVDRRICSMRARARASRPIDRPVPAESRRHRSARDTRPDLIQEFRE